MSFLKSLGAVLQTASAFVPATAPLLALTVPKAAPILNDIATINAMISTIVQVEQMGQQLKLTGEQKLQVAAPQIAQLLAQSPLLIGRKVKDADEYKQDVEQLTSALVDLLNDFEDVKS